MHERSKIAIIGAGLMGHGIAYVLTKAGHEVRIFDRSQVALDSLQNRLVEIAKLFDEDASFLKNISVHSDAANAGKDAEFAIEAATENLEVKQIIVAELEAVMASDAVIATNTSALTISDIGANAQYPERIVGAHFWNPPHLVKLVEIVQGAKTSDGTVAKTIKLMANAGHRAVHVKKDIRGAIGNRLQHALKREAIALVANGVCEAETVDEVVKLGFGQRLSVLGPLEQSDMVGLDLTKAIHDTLIPDLDITAKTHPYLDQLIADGHMGMATGEGFRKWTPEETETVRKRLRDFLTDQARTKK